MQTPIIGYVTLYHLLAYFFIYAFFGWCVEVVFATLKTGKFVNRGFLNGPVCPIYGVGVAVCVLFLNPIADKWWLLFPVGALFASFLEFVTGFVLERIFKTKWWDYSKEPFNVKGYVCLRFSLLWGLAIMLIFYTLVPLTNRLINAVPFKWWGAGIILLCVAILVADIITDVVQLKNLKNNLLEKSRIAELLRKDSDFVGGKISDATVVLVKNFKVIYGKISNSRIIKAFPRLNADDKDKDLIKEERTEERK